MAAPASSTRMRLTVVVEALAEENAHGEYRDMALAAFKERRFAMPVQLDHTFEMVWADIEQRYKTNYLAPHQAAAFSIKKLQDAYECDLDMTDTVGAIFEGEPDRKMHMIRVIPHFIFRETSVVPGSMLRPQKRLGDDMDSPEHSDNANVNGNKRRRVESLQRQNGYEARISSPNRPIPSTEALPASTAATAAVMDTDAHSVRSRSSLSFVETSRKETGQDPFGANHVKQESPELAEPLRSSYTGPREQSQTAPQPLEDNVPAAEDGAAEHAGTAPSEHTSVPQRDSHEAAIHQSPISSDEGAPEQESAAVVAPARTTRTSRDVYRVPSLSPEFMHKKASPDKPGKTYGRSPHTGADLLNMARRLGRTNKEADTTQFDSPASVSRRAQAFQRVQPDEIEPTPQENASSGQNQALQATTNDGNNDGDEDDLTASFLEEASAATPSNTQVSAPRKSSKPIKPGSLKKPSRASLTNTPMGTKRGAKSKFAATPVSIGSADKIGTKSTATTPASAASSNVGTTPDGQSISRLERLQLILSQGTPAGQGNKSSPARSIGHKSRIRNSRSSPEVRIPGTTKNAPGTLNTESATESINTHQATRQTVATEGSDTSPLQRAKHLGSVAKATSRAVDEGETALPQTFKKPARTIRVSPAQLSSTKKASATPTAGLPRRSEVPLPLNVRHLRRSSSLQSSPLVKGITGATDAASSAPPKPHAKPEEALQSNATTLEDSAVQPIEQSSSKDPINDAIIISSAEPSSTDYSSSDEGGGINGPSPGTNAVNNKDVSLNESAATFTEEQLANDTTDQLKPSHSQGEPNSTLIIPNTQEKPPSGQNSDHSLPWNSASWNFGNIDKITRQDGQLEQEPDRKEHPLAATNTALAPEGEGFADQEVYSTAIEDNVSKSRSSSVADSTRSSPAVSRRPARFLSHSPTPDTSESEDDSDEASAAAVRATSTQTNGKDESDSESDSSTDSSDDEDVEMTEFPPASTVKNNTASDPPSSPPLNGLTGSTPTVPATSQAVSSQMKPPVQRTPVPPPTQQSSQAPRSSQSVSAQAADRRRYTGFRSLREQLADTKTAQAATQKKVFDPRTMSLGKLTKGKPFTSLEENDESSDDESSSSSSSDSD
ncbi:hypothetical protein E8E13_008340 [Curvularia kusanoi]|uniref:Nucleolar protein Dnt1-like N-terminal domain-containing protein n=1 Tax=Curvularia kusanoi TaxID=90978 RepID=A0A9P4WDI0_CURKU|nr:hypothetical protein E8E13_008340 [Curvularia kusanoi]